MKTPWNIAALALVSVAYLACEEPLKPAQRIDESRVLGVRVSTQRGEASLVPGEPARAEFLLAGPEGPQPARVGYRFCEAASSQRGVPYCAAKPWAEGETDVGTDAIAAVDVPVSLMPGTRLALLGAACVAGEPVLADSPLNDRCSDDEAPLRFSFDAWTIDDTPHFNPDLSGLAITLGGESIALSAAGDAPACDGASPTLGAGQKHALAIELGAAALAEKELQLSHFSTQGELERQFSFVTRGQGPHVTLTWQAPQQVGPVKQYLVVRDGLGGVSWSTWNVCVR